MEEWVLFPNAGSGRWWYGGGVRCFVNGVAVWLAAVILDLIQDIFHRWVAVGMRLRC